jgi:hypothetical protein
MKEHTCAHLSGQETKISAFGTEKMANDWLTTVFFFRFWPRNRPGGTNPHESVALNSFVAETIIGLPSADRHGLLQYGEDFQAFSMELLSPLRTFVEKLVAIHCALAKGVENVRTRHYYDVHSLFEKSAAVKSFVESGEFSELVRNVVAITIEYFDKDLDPELDLSQSPALALRDDQIAALSAQYAREAQFYFKGQPAFSTLLKSVGKIRNALRNR